MQFTRPATWDDVKTIARYFAEAGVEYALVGGYAIAAHGFNRFSEDIDVLVNPTAENARRWIAALSRLPSDGCGGAGGRRKGNPQDLTSDPRRSSRFLGDFRWWLLGQRVPSPRAEWPAR